MQLPSCASTDAEANFRLGGRYDMLSLIVMDTYMSVMTYSCRDDIHR
jgi:hypothetical protein